jgi:predicted phage-related endonuclease
MVQSYVIAGETRTPMSAALRLYEQLTEAKDDKTRARLIAEAFDELEDRFPQLADLATQGHVRESELRLQKEIKEAEGRLRKEIKEVEGRLRKEIEAVRKETEQIRLETKALEVRLTQAMHRQTMWIIGAVGAIVGLVSVLDALIT